MKLRYSLSILFACILTACEKQLDLAPVTNLTSDTYYKTADDAKSAIGACYAQLGSSTYGSDALMFIDLVTTDDAIPFLTGAADRPLLWRYTFTPSNAYVSIYNGTYTAINRSNIVIARLPAIAMDETLKKRYIAEAKFLRALQYFNLVRIYGAVPVVTMETASSEGLNVVRNPVDEVYALIESDLKEAESVLPVTYPAIDGGRATKGAAKALLAKVYLTKAGTTQASPYWAQAAAKAREVMDLGAGYDLWANYADAFALSARGGKEQVFEVQFLTDVRGHGYGGGYGPRAAPIYPGTGSGIARPTASLFNLFTPADKRKDVTFITSFVYNGVTTNLSITDPDPTKAVGFQKLWDKTAKTATGNGTSFPVIRYAEVLLTYAEALNESNNGPTPDAYAALNRVRVRAGLDPVTGMDYQAFRSEVWLQRRLEFVFEDQRRFDLVRTGRLIDAVKAENSFSRNAAIQPFHVLLPIPQSQIDVNPNLTQNTGY